MRLHAGDLALGALDALFLAVATQELCVQPSVEMKRVANIRHGRIRIGPIGPGKLVLFAGQQIDAVVGQPADLAGLVHFEPVMVKVDQRHVPAHRAKAVDIAVTFCTPVSELDAQLEGRLGLPHELVFVDTQGGIEGEDRGNRRFTHADRRDLV